jgi:hypothetical protein
VVRGRERRARSCTQGARPTPWHPYMAFTTGGGRALCPQPEDCKPAGRPGATRRLTKPKSPTSTKTRPEPNTKFGPGATGTLPKPKSPTSTKTRPEPNTKFGPGATGTLPKPKSPTSTKTRPEPNTKFAAKLWLATVHPRHTAPPWVSHGVGRVTILVDLHTVQMALFDDTAHTAAC